MPERRAVNCALLVIDMQHALLHGATARHALDQVIANINAAAASVRAAGGHVIFVQHADAELISGTPGWQIAAGLHRKDGDVAIEKTACDSFADTRLAHLLEAFAASTLIVCGMATEFCVDTSLRAALSRRFQVIALADAHTTGDRPHLDAASIIAHHNWTWSNLIPAPGASIQVLRTAEFLALH